jgi:hypothetical protein
LDLCVRNAVRDFIAVVCQGYGFAENVRIASSSLLRNWIKELPNAAFNATRMTARNHKS